MNAIDPIVSPVASVPTVSGAVIQYSDYSFTPGNPFAGGCAWIEREYVPAAQARISVRDSGFTHSDATYTVAHAWHGVLFRLEDHLDRFLAGVEAMRIPMPYTKPQLAELMLNCVAKSELREAYVSITATRGIGKKAGDRNFTPTDTMVYVYAVPFSWIFPPEQQINGATAVVARETRRVGRHNIDPQVKNYQWGDLMRAAYESMDRGADTAFLLDNDNLVAEGPGFNIFVVKDGAIATPSRNALPGITRRTAIELADRAGVPAAVRDVENAELYTADELFVTTTAGGITPIIELDGLAVGNGTPGPITTGLRDSYWQSMDEPSPWNTPIDYERRGWPSR